MTPETLNEMEEMEKQTDISICYSRDQWHNEQRVRWFINLWLNKEVLFGRSEKEDVSPEECMSSYAEQTLKTMLPVRTWYSTVIKPS